MVNEIKEFPNGDFEVEKATELLIEAAVSMTGSPDLSRLEPLLKLPTNIVVVDTDEWRWEIKLPEEPYVFARDQEIERKIANDKRRETEGSEGSKSEDKQGSGKRDGYVPFREW